MQKNKKKVKAIGLCSGGLDSTLAGVVVRRQGIEVVWVSFETPFFSAEKAKKASDMTGIPLIVKDITEPYLPMLKNPTAGYGGYMNPCMDCHALMFRIAGQIMQETGADFLFSGEVTGQRPMSQTRSSLRYVEKKSGYDGMILRPLSAKLLPETEMEKKGLVDREQLLDFSGRSRKPQIEMARSFNMYDYPSPAGGCLLTDPNFSNRLKDLLDHVKDPGRKDFELLRHGRHMRLSSREKLVVGRNREDNNNMMSLYSPEKDVKIIVKEIPGPVGIIPGGSASEDSIKAGAAICAGYSRAGKDRHVQVHVISPAGRSVLSVKPAIPDQIGDLLIL